MLETELFSRDGWQPEAQEVFYAQEEGSAQAESVHRYSGKTAEPAFSEVAFP